MAKIVTNEREISSLLGYFSKRVQTIFAVYGKDSKKRAKNMKLASIFFTAATRNKRCIAFNEPWLCSFTIANKFALYSLAQALRRRNIYVPKGVRLAAPESIFDVYIIR